MWYDYIIRSINFPEQEYIGATADLKRRLPEHNAGKSTHTAKFKPWKLLWYCAFPDKYKALAFEKYLKSHSGLAVAKKRPHVLIGGVLEAAGSQVAIEARLVDRHEWRQAHRYRGVLPEARHQPRMRI